ncbi:alpha-L-fucosidase C-terminal domain-containing protein [Foetidibacter luteolus]
MNLLGHNGTLQWNQTTDGLAVTLPEKPPCDNAYVLKIVG